MAKTSRAKHKLCRRIGYCIWDNPKCPSVKRPFPAGSGKGGRRRKLSTFGEMLIEKQKLKASYGISEKQLSIAYKKAKKGEGQADEKLISQLEQRLDALVYRSGLSPSIFAAKQAVNHRHIKVDGRTVDRSSYLVKEGQVVSMNSEKSPSLAEQAKNSNATVPGYLEVDREKCQATLVRAPEKSEIPVNVELIRVIEFYAR